MLANYEYICNKSKSQRAKVVDIQSSIILERLDVELLLEEEYLKEEIEVT